jgi:hypothetical protein
MYDGSLFLAVHNELFFTDVELSRVISLPASLWEFSQCERFLSFRHLIVIVIQQALANQIIDDALTAEFKDQTGDRVHYPKFGNGADGRPIVSKYGAN